MAVPQIDPSNTGLTETVNLIVNATNLLNNLERDNAVIMNPTASIQDRIAAYNDLVSIKSGADYGALNKASPKVAAFFAAFDTKLDGVVA
jgi:hypothetical protein